MNQAKWIWWGGEKTVNQYVDFQKEFTVASVDAAAEIKISADSEYALFLNGEMVGCCQYDDYPDQKVYDTYKVGHLLKPGKNTLSVAGYFQGTESTQYPGGEPGLWFCLTNGSQTILSDSSVLCQKSGKYASGKREMFTEELGFTFAYDAQGEDAPWENAAEVGRNASLSPRPIEQVQLTGFVPGKLISQGYFMRTFWEGTVAQQMMRDYLSFRRAMGAEKMIDGTDFPIALTAGEGDGVYLIFDLEKERTGYLTFTVDANAGAVMEIAYGEHLEDLRVRSKIGNRHFAVSYICKEGEQTFTHWFKRLGGRYLQVHIRNFTKAVIQEMGLIHADYPFDRDAGQFVCNDVLHNKIFEVCKHTLNLCAHEHYEDSVWREQGLWGLDSRFQMLSTYYAFGNYEFPRSNLDLLGQKPLGNGQIRMCGPYGGPETIPSFNLWWAVAMAEYAEFSGDLTLAEEHWDTLTDMLKTNVSWAKDGIVSPPKMPKWWHLYEWTEGHGGQPDTIQKQMEPHYGEDGFYVGIYHLIFWIAMKKILELAQKLGKHEIVENYQPLAAEYADAYCQRFWDEEAQNFFAYDNHGEKVLYGELSPTLVLWSGICQDERINEILYHKLLHREYPIPTMLSNSAFKYEALMKHNPACTGEVFRQIGERWGVMLEKGATTFWETDLGAADFAEGGSCCHGWSSIPIYLYLRYGAGIQPDGSVQETEPVFGTLRATAKLQGNVITVTK